MQNEDHQDVIRHVLTYHPQVAALARANGKAALQLIGRQQLTVSDPLNSPRLQTEQGQLAVDHSLHLPQVGNTRGVKRGHQVAAAAPSSGGNRIH